MIDGDAAPLSESERTIFSPEISKNEILAFGVKVSDHIPDFK